MRFYSSSEATEKCFSVSKCPFKDQGYCLGMSKSMWEHYFRLEPKAESKTHFLIGSRAFAELFLQTHHFPSLPLLSGANFIISSLLLLHFNKQSLSFLLFIFSLFYFCSSLSIPLLLSSPESSSLYYQTVYRVLSCPNTALSCFFSLRHCFLIHITKYKTG